MTRQQLRNKRRKVNSKYNISPKASEAEQLAHIKWVKGKRGRK